MTNVLAGAPNLLAMLFPGDLPALLATCREARDIIHANVQSIKVMREGHTALLFKGSWPNLRSLSFMPYSLVGWNCQKLRMGNWPSLTTLSLPRCGLQAASVRQLALSALPQLKHLDLSYNRLGGHGITFLV